MYMYALNLHVIYLLKTEMVVMMRRLIPVAEIIDGK